MTDQPNPPPAPQAATSVPTDAPSVQKPDEAQTSLDVLAQPSTAAALKVAPQEPQGSAQQREAAGYGGPPCSGSAVKGSGSSPLPTRQLQAECAHNVSAVQDSGDHPTCLPKSAYGPPLQIARHACLYVQDVQTHQKFSCLGIS